MKTIHYLYIFVSFLGLTSCAQFVEIDPPVNAITDATAYQKDATATSVVTGLFQTLNNSAFISGGQGVGFFTGLQSDELRYHLTTASYLEFATNSLRSDNSYVLSLWTRGYLIIYSANAVIEGVSNSSTLSPHVKEQLLGEAKFMRALMFFYLVNLYGDVPLPLTTNYQTNITLSRSDTEDVYRQIVSDLEDAKELLKEEYLSAANTTTTDRVRPNRAAATALLARAYLYTEDWANAETNASEVIAQSTAYRLEPNLDDTFLIASKEAIWQLGFGPNVSGLSSYDGYNYILTANPTTNYPGITLTESLMNELEGDNRESHWTNGFVVGSTAYPYAYKYKVRQGSSGSAPSEHMVMLRLAEQYLIRAEARAMQENFEGGAADLNAVRLRAEQLEVNPADIHSFMLALEEERRLELFTEWGHRWFDMKRWKGFDNPSISRADEIMPAITAAKGGTWRPEYKLWPIPANEILTNVNLEPNPGYGL